MENKKQNNWKCYLKSWKNHLSWQIISLQWHVHPEWRAQRSKECGVNPVAKQKIRIMHSPMKKKKMAAKCEEGVAAQPSNGYGNNKLFPSRKRCKNVAGEGKSNKMRAKLAVEHENSSVRPMHIHPWSSELQRGSRRNNFSYTCHAPPTNRAKCVETLAWRTAPPTTTTTNQQGGWWGSG